jgi:hypothetical protein
MALFGRIHAGGEGSPYGATGVRKAATGASSSREGT